MIAASTPTLMAFAGRYCAGKIGLSPAYCLLLQATARKFTEFCGDDIQTQDLSADLVTRWCRYLLLAGIGRVTVAGKRRLLLTLWRSAATCSLAPPPGVLEQIRVLHHIPEAWTAAEIEAIVAGARRQPGMVGAIPAALWWPSLILAIYWTATRIGALLRCRSTDCSLAGRWLLVGAGQQKNGRAQLHQLPDEAVAAIAAHYDPGRLLLWPWPFHPRTVWNRFRRIAEAAGVPCPRTHLNLFHRIRRTSLSYQWAADPGIAQRCAGHSSPAILLASYVDPRIAVGRTAADVLPRIR